MTPTYCIYLNTPKGEETIITGEKDPRRIHRIVTGKKFTKRVSKFGCSFHITRDNKVMKFQAFERLVLDLWFEDAEDDNEELEKDDEASNSQ